VLEKLSNVVEKLTNLLRIWRHL